MAQGPAEEGLQAPVTRSRGLGGRPGVLGLWGGQVFHGVFLRQEPCAGEARRDRRRRRAEPSRGALPWEPNLVTER